MGLKIKKKVSKVKLFLIDLSLYLLMVSTLSLPFILGMSVSEDSKSEKVAIEKPVLNTKYIAKNTQKVQTTQRVKKDTQKVFRKSPKVKVKKYSLIVNTTPKNARVKILNIKEKFHQGLKLKAGRYHLSISEKGYETLQFWIKMNGNTTLNESLLPNEY